jgi:ketosteroid isomerase-like protein
MDRDEQVIHQIYKAFNARDMQGVLALLTDDVAWANGMEGTHIYGKDAIRDYWTHQWSVISHRPGRPSLTNLYIRRA